MSSVCPIHNVEMEEKEGQYGSYWSHTIADQGYCNGKRISPFKKPQTPNTPLPPAAPSKVATGDWDDQEKSKQITRLTLAKTYINAGVDFDNAVQNADLEKWVDWIFSGNVPRIAKDNIDVNRVIKDMDAED